MIMNKEIYKDLVLRFSKELHEVGVTDEMKKLVEAQYDRAPNVVSSSSEEVTDKFVYRHGGYLIEAERTVKLVLRKCS